MAVTTRLPWVLLLCGLTACVDFQTLGDDYCAQNPADCGDAGASDAGAVDAGAVDAGQPDAGPTDAGVVDAGVDDAGIVDAGVTDAGAGDAGLPDAGGLDAGSGDAGAPDSGVTTRDAGMVDGGACPTPLAVTAPTGCTVYSFTNGLPPGLQQTAAAGITSTLECGMLHVVLPPGTWYDNWWDNNDAFRLEVSATRTSSTTLSVAFHGALAQTEQLVATYTREADRYVGGSLGFVYGANAPNVALYDYTLGSASNNNTSAGPEVPGQVTAATVTLVRPASGNPRTLTIAAALPNDGGTTTSTHDFSGLGTSYVVGVQLGSAGLRDANNSVIVSPPGLDAYLDWVQVCP